MCGVCCHYGSDVSIVFHVGSLVCSEELHEEISLQVLIDSILSTNSIVRLWCTIFMNLLKSTFRFGKHGATLCLDCDSNRFNSALVKAQAISQWQFHFLIDARSNGHHSDIFSSMLQRVHLFAWLLLALGHPNGEFAFLVGPRLHCMSQCSNRECKHFIIRFKTVLLQCKQTNKIKSKWTHLVGKRDLLSHQVPLNSIRTDHSRTVGQVYEKFARRGFGLFSSASYHLVPVATGSKQCALSTDCMLRWRFQLQVPLGI